MTMYPAHMWTDSYPHQANSMRDAPITDQRANEIPSRMKMDPSTLNSPYQPWPYGGNHCYPVPHEYHGCCNHGYFGCPYRFQPPYPHYPPPPPFHPHGFYPPFPGAYPSYSIPPPHYSIERPRYDYDKNTHTDHHCCGCKHLEDEKKSRIEREEPEVEKKTSNSLVPFLLKDYPNSIMWVPPDYMNNESRAKEKEKHSHDPGTIKPLEPVKQGGNDETIPNQQGGDNRLPFQIFWLPSENNEVGKDIKEDNHLDLVSHRSDDKTRQIRKNDEGSGSEAESDTSSKHVVQKVIPVKQLGTEEEKKSLKNIETKSKSGSVEKTDNGKEESPKRSKLPPVCLRIDPLPKRKNNSRSPSSPGVEGRSNGSPKNDTKSSPKQTRSSDGLTKSKEERSYSNIKTIQVTDVANKVESNSLATPCENEYPKGTSVDNTISLQEQTQLPEGSKKSKEEQNEGNDANKVEEDSNVDPSENVPSGEVKENGETSKVERKNLSEQEAALMTQSAYRGFEVRKSQPLMKLRQIGDVRKQADELRNRIRDLDSSSSTTCIDEKQKLIIGETIMSLLLKLDTIQGLHTFVRNVRKSVAKELVDLQEKLDSLTITKSEVPSEETASSTEGVNQEKAVEAQSDSNVKVVESGMGSFENCQVETTGVQDDDGAEACNNTLEPQVELQNVRINGEFNNNELSLDDAIQDKFDQAQTQSDCNCEAVGSDMGVCENERVEATDSVDETHDMNPELQMPIETDEAQAESGTNVGVMDSNIDICEHHGVVAADSEDGVDAEACDIKIKRQVELESQQSIKEATDNQLQMETELPVEDGNVGIMDSNVEHADSGDDLKNQFQVLEDEVEAKECRNDVNGREVDDEVPPPATVEVEKDVHMVEPTGGLPKENAENEGVEIPWGAALEVEKDGSMAEMKAEANNEARAALEALEVEKDVCMVEMKAELAKEDENTSVKVMEENQKLRGAVEVMMKAGKEQLGVIKELTGRVKELEKKLSKKKKIKVKKCRSRGCVVE